MRIDTSSAVHGAQCDEFPDRIFVEVAVVQRPHEPISNRAKASATFVGLKRTTLPMFK